MNVNVNPNEGTEFHDALRARGIIPPKPPSRSPSPELPSEAQLRSNQLKQATVDDIDLELQDGLNDEEEEKILERLRRDRISQLAKETKTHRFGRVYPITRPDYTREVTEASKQNPDGVNDANDSDDDDGRGVETGAGPTSADPNNNNKKGTGVVCFLYKEGMETCKLLAGYLDRLAAKYPATKFVSIVGDKCIPNYPDRNLPTLLIYRNGDLHRQIVGLRPEIGLDGINTKCEDIELLLTAVGVLDRSNVPGAATYQGNGGSASQRNDEEGGNNDDNHQDSDDEGFGDARRRTIRNGVLGKSIQTQKSQQEEVDELDWDL